MFFRLVRDITYWLIITTIYPKQKNIDIKNDQYFMSNSREALGRFVEQKMWYHYNTQKQDDAFFLVSKNSYPFRWFRILKKCRLICQSSSLNNESSINLILLPLSVIFKFTENTGKPISAVDNDWYKLLMTKTKFGVVKKWKYTLQP